MTSSPSVATRGHGGIPLWVFVLSMLVVVGAWSGWNAYVDYLQVMEQEYRLLEVQATQREARISGALRSVNLMLGSIIEDLPDHPERRSGSAK